MVQVHEQEYDPCDTQKHGCFFSEWIQVVHPADMCFKLPENITLEEGAMCEPLSVGVHACNRASVGPTTKVLILGAGPIGLVTLLTAHAYGSPKVIIADVSVERLKVAKELGANATVLLSTLESVSKLLFSENWVYGSQNALQVTSFLCLFGVDTYPSGSGIFSVLTQQLANNSFNIDATHFQPLRFCNDGIEKHKIVIMQPYDW